MARNYHQGLFNPTNPSKYMGNVRRIVFRSSWELKFMQWADINSNVIQWSSEETVVPYICPTDNRPHRYFVDFKVTVRTVDGVSQTYLVEVKPEAQTQPPVAGKKRTKRYLNEVLTWGKNQAKWEAANQYASQRGWQFIVLTERHLFPGT